MSETVQIKINVSKFGISETVNITKGVINESHSNETYIKYLKLMFNNKSRFKSRFINTLEHGFNEIEKNIDFASRPDFEKFIKELELLYDELTPFTFQEAYGLERNLSAKVFGAIGVETMIKELGSTRIKTEGMPVKHKQYDASGNFVGYKEYDVIYEVHEINTEKLNLTEKGYMVKCWCTSTNKEHWLWIEEEYKDSPLEAIASTCRPHENIIPFITAIKRQGDVFIYELSKDIEPDLKKPRVPLSAKQFFNLLVAQS